MAKSRELLFSVTKADLVRQTFRCGGKGGQNVNKVETGVRFIHPPSGAVGEGREHRTQHANEKAAFERLVSSEAFRKWHRLECARRTGQLAQIEQEVADTMRTSNLLIEGKKDGRWVPLSAIDTASEP